MTNKIIALPNPHLRQSSKKVGFISEELKKLIELMKLATLDWEKDREHEVGVALAAVQVDRLTRIIVVRNDFNDKTNQEFTAFINPQIVKEEGELVEDFEGCLSVPDIYGKVSRHSKVKVKALDEAGRPVRVNAEGFLARVFQHEIDHLKGTLFIDHIKTEPDAFFRLTDEGKLEQMNYDTDIRDSRILW